MSYSNPFSYFSVSMSEFKLNEFEGTESFCRAGSEGFRVGDVDGDGR